MNKRIADNSKQESPALTELIQRATRGERIAKDLLYQHVYADLRRVAHQVNRRYRQSELHTTALVNEVVLRFEKSDSLQSLPSRRAFFAVAARAMNQILIDHYRRRKKNIDGPGRQSLPFDFVLEQLEDNFGIEFADLNDELKRLEEESPREHAVILHRFFAGLTIKETAELLEVSVQTVERDWRLARAKLLKRLER